MSKTRIQLPAAVREQIRQLSVRPTIALREDRDEFLASVAPEHAVEAEQVWNERVKADEDGERHYRATNGDGDQVRREPYFLSIDQIATRWNVSGRTVWRMVRDGRLPSVLIGSLRRIREEDVEKFETVETQVA